MSQVGGLLSCSLCAVPRTLKRMLPGVRSVSVRHRLCGGGSRRGGVQEGPGAEADGGGGGGEGGHQSDSSLGIMRISECQMGQDPEVSYVT